ncbi:ribosome assembly RNA-binding protein YhbY [Deltaproteobacteria bacterium]|nr:ribosome assembly RNA-binding protein YhbY [Deltaproteobacteria bacterium]
MKKLKGFQKRYLRGLAHDLKPIVLIGQKGLTTALLKSAEEAIRQHELIKVKFNEFKKKEEKAEISARIESKTGSEVAGTIGHTVIFFRQQDDPEKRKITLPRRS